MATALGGSDLEVSSRRASTSGQRRFSLGVDLNPVVIEAPNATIVPVALAFATSNPQRNIQSPRVRSIGSALLAANSPGWEM
jgi:hypothetical protein